VDKDGLMDGCDCRVRINADQPRSANWEAAQWADLPSSPSEYGEGCCGLSRFGGVGGVGVLGTVSGPLDADG
jgi:hypothetical protein